MKIYDVVIIGGGPAGLAAAFEAKKYGAKEVLIIERNEELGGILQQCIHNGFGIHQFREELTGPEYAERFINKVKKANIECMLNTMVLGINKDKVITIISKNEGYISIKGKAIILSMGCRERTREALMIPGTRPSGIFTAGTAQRFINIEGYMVGKKVFILGSGDIGLIMARRLTLEGAEVVGVAEILPYSCGLNRNIEQCLKDFDIPLLLQHTVIEVKGRERLEGVVVVEVDDKNKPLYKTKEFYKCDTLLLSVGLIPENELSIQVGVEIDGRTKGPIVNESMETSVDGVFACGNVVHVHDLVDYVTDEGRLAGKGAIRYLNNLFNKANKGDYITTECGKGVKYIIPQRLRMEHLNEWVMLHLRTDKNYDDVEIQIVIQGDIIKTIKKSKLSPSEMIRLRIPSDLIVNREIDNIKVEINERS
ncbi:MAG: FAD-dependent oxidoreductase [Firmicutes bacterium]|nr:FAD-dependent oxidoreductase [Bacillota bacterium]